MLRLLIGGSQTELRQDMREGLGVRGLDSRNSLVPLHEGGLSEKFSNGAIEKISDPSISDNPFFHQVLVTFV